MYIDLLIRLIIKIIHGVAANIYKEYTFSLFPIWKLTPNIYFIQYQIKNKFYPENLINL